MVAIENACETLNNCLSKELLNPIFHLPTPIFSLPTQKIQLFKTMFIIKPFAEPLLL